MKFRKGSAYHLVSDCGEYSIAKVIIAGEITYEAWHIPKDSNGRQVALSVRQPTSLECIGICRRHQQRAAPAA